MSGIALTLVTLVLLAIASGFFLLGELEESFRERRQ